MFSVAKIKFVFPLNNPYMIDYKKWILRMQIFILSMIAVILYCMYGTWQAQQDIIDNLAYASCDGYAYDREQATELCR